jgi:hypothetical protein
VLSARQYLTAAPGPLTNDNTWLSSPTTPTVSPTPTPPSTAPAEIVLHAAGIGAAALHGNWALVSDATAADGVSFANADHGAAKLSVAAAAPASYVDVPFTAQAGVPYQIWLRMRAIGDSFANDSVYVQLSGAVDAGGNPVARIGTTQGDAVVLQDYTGAPISAWGWNDNGWAGLGRPYIFAQSGLQTLRLQQREDGIVIDQIVISPARYLTAPPGATTNDTTIVR